MWSAEQVRDAEDAVSTWVAVRTVAFDQLPLAAASVPSTSEPQPNSVDLSLYGIVKPLPAQSTVDMDVDVEPQWRHLMIDSKLQKAVSSFANRTVIRARRPTKTTLKSCLS